MALKRCENKTETINSTEQQTLDFALAEVAAMEKEQEAFETSLVEYANLKKNFTDIKNSKQFAQYETMQKQIMLKKM